MYVCIGLSNPQGEPSLTPAAVSEEPIGFWAVAQAHPERLAVVEASGRSISYGELAELTNRFAHLLAGMGSQLVVMTPNCIEHVALGLAAYQSGIRWTPVSWRAAPRELAHVLADSEASVLAAHERAAAAFEASDAQVAVPHKLLLSGAPPSEPPPARPLATRSQAEGRFLAARSLAGGRSLAARSLAARPLAEGWQSLEEAARTQPPTRPEHPRTGSVMLYTSGTTGRPKGVRRRLPDRHPDESAAKSVRLLRFFGIEAHGGNVHLCAAPLHHAAAGVWVSLSLHMGHGVVLMDGWDEIGALELIERRRVTHTHMVPTMFVRLLRLDEETRSAYDTSSLRWVVHAAAPCPVEVKRRMLDWWGDCIYEYYAATEGGGTLVGPEEWRRHPGTVGKPWPGSEVIVADSEDLEGRRLAAGEVGTVYMRQVRAAPFEYHNDPSGTQAVRHPNNSSGAQAARAGGLTGEDAYAAEGDLGTQAARAGGLTGEDAYAAGGESGAQAARSGGFFTAGDVGYFNEDGYLFLVDRAADVIVTGGVNVYPAEVEAALAECPLVADAAVFGVPSEDLGEEIKAVVCLSEGVEPDEDARAGILAFLRGRISSRSRPHSLDFAECLPRDDAGKLNRRSLRDPYWQGRPRRI